MSKRTNRTKLDVFEKERTLNRVCKIVAYALAACLLAATAQASTTTEVDFEAKETFEGASAVAPGWVTGLLTVPAGDGPFPTVVLLHGCAGPQQNHQDWAEIFASWGYASFRIDSFGPRDIAEICTDIRRAVPRVADVNGAMDYLKTQSVIDHEKIAVMGFSHGANVTLLVAGDPGSLAPRHKPALKSAIALYPYCPTTPQRFGPPLMILIGDADDWTPADPCVTLAEDSVAADQPINLVVYEGATHSYDCRACNGEYWGHNLVHHPSAHEDSIIRVREFLLAGLGAGLVPVTSGEDAPESGTKLDASNIEQALAGSTTKGVNDFGNPYTVQIWENGQTTGVAGHDDEFEDVGSWWIEDDMYCRRWDVWLDNATGCFHVVIDGDAIRWLNSDGSLARQETYIAP